MFSGPPSPPLHVTVTAEMQAPSFVPGTMVSATITLHAKYKRPLASSQSANVPNRPRPQLLQSVSSASSMLASFPHSAVARVDYIVAELSGRWTGDRSWLKPGSHESANPSLHLDNHTQAPQASSSSRTVRTTANDPTLGPYPWSAALADANAIGGGGRSGYTGILFRSHPLIVCEREQIPAGSQVSFAVDAVLPDLIPPTLRGSAMRYGYALIIVVKFPDAQVPHVLRVPFRVLPTIHKAIDPASNIAIRIPVPTPRDVGPRPNRFLQHDDATALRMSARLLKSAPPDDIEIALALSMNGRLTRYSSDVEHKRIVDDEKSLVLPPLQIHSPDGMFGYFSSGDSSSFPPSSGGLRVYSITRGIDPVARMYFSKRVHHLGDSLHVMFDFHGDRACYRIGARLEMQEIIAAQYAVGYQDTVTAATATAMAVAAAGAGDSAVDGLGSSGHALSGDSDGTTDIGDGDGVVFRKVYGDYNEFVTAARNTEVTFSIPHDAPTSFSTGVVTVRWLLHFMFVVPKAIASKVITRRSRSDTIPQENGEEKSEIQRADAFGAMESVGKPIHGLAIKAEHEDADPSSITDIGWRGGVWKGEDPRNWTHIPDKEVDVLRWTLPIVVSGQPESPWGLRSVNKLSYVSMS